jgi:hypothetical protein
MGIPLYFLTFLPRMLVRTKYWWSDNSRLVGRRSIHASSVVTVKMS